MDNAETKLMDVKSACEFLNIKTSHLRALVFKRKIPVIKVGRLLRFKIEQLENWLTQHEQK